MNATVGDERPPVPPHTIDDFKKEAKRLLKLLRFGNRDARARLEHAISPALLEPRLRDVQHAIALEQGFTGWAAPKEHFAGAAADDYGRDERANWFLEHACIDPILTNGPSAQAQHRAAALRMLVRHPDVARVNIHTSVVCGDIVEVKRILAAQPHAAIEMGGPVRHRHNQNLKSQWTPILHLCYGRLPVAAASDNAVAILHALLDHGANPNDYFEVGSHPSRYTALTGVVGGARRILCHIQRRMRWCRSCSNAARIPLTFKSCTIPRKTARYSVGSIYCMLNPYRTVANTSGLSLAGTRAFNFGVGLATWAGHGRQ